MQSKDRKQKILIDTLVPTLFFDRLWHLFIWCFQLVVLASKTRKYVACLWFTLDITDLFTM